MNFKTLDRLREGAAVTRFHTARTIRLQSVGEHSHGVALILMALDAGPEVIAAAITHDLHEIETGDVPATTKWKYLNLAADLRMVEAKFEKEMGIYATLDTMGQQLLKWADMFELVLWANEEMWMGNAFAQEIRNRGIQYLLEMGSPTVAASNLLNEFMGTYVDERE